MNQHLKGTFNIDTVLISVVHLVDDSKTQPTTVAQGGRYLKNSKLALIGSEVNMQGSVRKCRILLSKKSAQQSDSSLNGHIISSYQSQCVTGITVPKDFCMLY